MCSNILSYKIECDYSRPRGEIYIVLLEANVSTSCYLKYIDDTLYKMCEKSGHRTFRQLLLCCKHNVLWVERFMHVKMYELLLWMNFEDEMSS